VRGFGGLYSYVYHADCGTATANVAITSQLAKWFKLFHHFKTFFARTFRKTSPRKTCAFFTVTPSLFYRYNKQNKFPLFANVCNSVKTPKKS